LEELVDRWVSREVPASDDFFKRLELRTMTTFFTGFLGAFGDFTAASTSFADGSSTTGVSAIGAAANPFGSCSSLGKGAKYKTIHPSQQAKDSILKTSRRVLMNP
jgi:hypothetical protein